MQNSTWHLNEQHFGTAQYMHRMQTVQTGKHVVVVAESSFLLAQSLSLHFHCCLISAAGDTAASHTVPVSFCHITSSQIFTLWLVASGKAQVKKTQLELLSYSTVSDKCIFLFNPQGEIHVSYIGHVLLWHRNSSVTSLVLLAPPVLFLLRLAVKERGLLFLLPRAQWPPAIHYYRPTYSQNRMTEDTCGFVLIWAFAAGQRSLLLFCSRANRS